jgi:hypothetical protein
VAVPADDGVRSDDDEVAAPSFRESLGENPQEPISAVQLRTRLGAGKNSELMSQEEVFQNQVAVTPQKASEERDKKPGYFSHIMSFGRRRLRFCHPTAHNSCVTGLTTYVPQVSAGLQRELRRA